jgi:hypothetical protein
VPRLPAAGGGTVVESALSSLSPTAAALSADVAAILHDDDLLYTYAAPAGSGPGSGSGSASGPRARALSAAAAEAFVARAAAAKRGAEAPLQAQPRDHAAARTLLERWFRAYTACTDFAADSAGGGGGGHGSGGDVLDLMRLHSGHALVLEARTTLANCCNAAEDFLPAARHLGALAHAMARVFPPPPAYHHPEASGVYAAWGDALRSALLASGKKMPRRMADGCRADMKAALEQCYQIRRVSMGPEHALTEEAEVQRDRLANTSV